VPWCPPRRLRSPYEFCRVQQLSAMAELSKYALDHCSPKSLAVLGVAGGNRLEHIDPTITKRIVGVDSTGCIWMPSSNDLQRSSAWNSTVAR
jgi:hypothetical protein